jgi:uncharacterized protein
LTVTVESTITFPYRRSLGPVLGAFMTNLREGRLIGIRCGDGVLCPPLEWDPRTGAQLAHDFVEVGPVGTVESWTWVSEPTSAHPFDRPFAFATIRLDGATTALVHVVDVAPIEEMHIGMRVVPRWRPERRGHITDIEAFEPGDRANAFESPAEEQEAPVSMMDYNASITYTTPVPGNVLRAQEASRDRRFLGLRCPTCGRTYTGGKGYCPVDAIALTAGDEVTLPDRGILTNFTIITPVQYPGQTETEPFARVHVLLDGTDVILGYQNLIDLPNDQIRIGMRLAAVWPSEAEREELAGDPIAQGFAGWMPSGEPDVDDPGLVNRIC